MVQALRGLIEVQKSSGFTKHLKPPTTFQPENRAEELAKWLDWRFQFETFVGAVDPTMRFDETASCAGSVKPEWT